MKFRIKTYLMGELKEDRTGQALEYAFNLMYRSIIPLLLFFMIIKWEKPLIANIFISLILLFFVAYQFTWSVRK